MKTKRILALFLAVVTCLSLAASAPAASISDFKDVDTKAWYAEAVTAAVDNGLLYGKSKTQLDPNGLLTRAEMAAITNRSFGCYKAADISAYKDVAKSKWYYKDVALAVQMGTYNGVSSTSMQPDRAITRQEAIAVVARALQLDLDDYAKTDLSKFADAKEVSKWALPYMKAMVAAGYVHGRTQGLVPQANITRAEFAQLYFNIIQSYITKSGSYAKDYKGNLLVRAKDIHDPQFVGECCYGSLGDLRVKARFTKDIVANQYPYLTVSILNPTKGEIDSVRMKIGDVVSRSCRSTNPNLRNTEPHIWVDGKTPQWYACCPGSRDYTLLANATAEYLSVFELTHERVQNRQHTQKMKGADAHAR